ncbi:carbohydrate binding family 9 domain-containing protein [Flavobacteriaceae bacterium XHP0103]|uniref:DUF5916 domain-containing protein n=1 Tax=Marixanthotalea marina TaxID=2844359 RepID=UPI002989BFF8|nr:DUF5916 domain-containing protein [Marixanthotalea marina]MBU3822590.1 carbohydrate binding family 9 domain-containing protein [Marixanthotalea marina]
MRFYLFIFIFITCTFLSFSQEADKKVYNIKKTNTPPKIDGILDDDVWKTAEEAKDFTQFRPDVGIKDTLGIKTIVKLTYDDEAIYLGAYLYDDPSKIMSQINTRDNFGQSDFFGFVLNPNNDAQNDTEFFVLSSGTQLDAIANPSVGEDFSWNAVWESKVNIVDDGWVVEMKIPYRALRFSNKEVQTWGVQFHRRFRRNQSQYTWNPIDPTKGNIGLYHGEIRNLENIQPPLRLSFYPFTSGLVNDFDGETTTDLKFGLDLKYGITENFTLDATLIPDFSQAGFDNLELNLGPFEQTFSEQRQFFTEGVDLFDKGNLFFSRRIGSRPTGIVDLNDGEVLDNYPGTVKVLNAVKISGRTKKGLGIGFFNAITEKTNATIRDTVSGNTREQVVEPLTNYNILVIDQQFNRNSSVSLINTNVTRSGNFRDANATGLVFDISDKSNNYNVRGEAKMSYLNLANDSTSTGYNTFIRIGKTGGNFRYSIDHRYSDTRYNINDLGLNRRNNFSNIGMDASYRIFEPTKIFNNYFVSTYINYNKLAKPNVFTGFEFGLRFNAQTRNLWGLRGNIEYQPGKQYDYFEPRVNGRYFIYEDRLSSDLRISTNNNKIFSINFNIGNTVFFENGRDSKEYSFGISPRIRFSDKFLVDYAYDYSINKKDRGYTSRIGDDIIFGERDRKIQENRLRVNYTFNPFHALSLTFRNYWDTVDYKENLFTLEENGRLTQSSGYTVDDLNNDPNINFNTWNIDLNYTWQFAPGSFLTALYRNQLFNRDNASTDNYGDSLETLFAQPMQNIFSLRIQYFIDYATLKNVFQKKDDS